MAPVCVTTRESSTAHVRFHKEAGLTAVCEGFTYSLSLVILDDGQASDYAYGATQTFDANPDGTTRAYYPFDTTM